MKIAPVFLLPLVVTASAWADQSLTKAEQELASRIEQKLTGAAVARWAVSFGGLISSLSGGAGDAAEYLLNEKWDTLHNALNSLETVKACSIVKEIDQYLISDEDQSDSGLAYFSQVRSMFEHDC